MKYLPVSESEIAEHLSALGLKNLDDLFRSIPSDLLTEPARALGEGLSEIEIRRHFAGQPQPELNFLGGNGHTHYVPSIIDPLISRGEFLTAYTPYQPEISQGTLQAIFEYQSMMANLMGVDVSNASLYDGSTATVEAGLMACRISQKHRLVVSGGLHREYLSTLRTYSENGPTEMATVPLAKDGRSDLTAIEQAIDGDTAAIIVQSPNAAGIIEDLDAIRQLCTKKDVLMIVNITEALSLALLKSPGSSGADIVCGEAQSFGIPLSMGGPWLGFIGTTSSRMRNLPGRLIGMSKDTRDRRAFVITLAAREQHIRREKATSNICSNQGLMALRAGIYLSVMGKKGLRRAAERSAKLTAYARTKLQQQSSIQIEYPASPVFNEFVVKLPVDAHRVFERCMTAAHIAPGTILDEHHMLSAFNETLSVRDVDRWLETLAAACK